MFYYVIHGNQIRNNLDAIIHLSGSVCFLCLPTLIFLYKGKSRSDDNMKDNIDMKVKSI